MSSICMYVPSSHGGHPRYAMELLTAMSQHPRAGHLYELFTSQNLHEEFRPDLYPVHAYLPELRERSQFANKLSWATSRMLHYMRREMQFVSWLKGRPDVAAVHFQEWTPWLAAPMVRRVREQGKRVFYTSHNVLPHVYPRMIPRELMHHWLRSACRLCDGIFVHTDQLAKRLSDFLGPDHPPLHIVPHGVWTSATGARQVAIKERLAWKKLLFFGSIRRNKGLEILLDAMTLLPGVSLTVAGAVVDPGYYHSEVLPRVQRLAAAGVQIDLRPRFMPENELAGLFRTSSAVVLPYTSGFVAQSGVVFMALAHEVPVIASEAGGLRDLFSSHKVGVTFKDGSPEALAAAVRQLQSAVEPGELLAQIRSAKEEYSWERAASATLDGYASVLGTASRRRSGKGAVTHDHALVTT